MGRTIRDDPMGRPAKARAGVLRVLGPRARRARRAAVGAVTAGLVGVTVFGAASSASAGKEQPTLTPSDATFTIPTAHDPAGTVWTLTVWSHGNRLGQTQGISGELDVPLPAIGKCFFQADVSKGTKYYSGTKGTFPGCGSTTTTSATTTTASNS